MKRNTYTLLLSCLFLLVFYAKLPAYAQSDDVLAGRIGQLEFEPMEGNGTLAIAQDDRGHTWIRGAIPAELLGIPIIFRIPSTRIHDYRFYLLQGDQLTHIPQNIDNHSRRFSSRFPAYELVTWDSVYYLNVSDHAPQV